MPSISTYDSINSGAATPKDTTGTTVGTKRAIDSNVAGVGGSAISLGQQIADSSVPVVLPASQDVMDDLTVTDTLSFNGDTVEIATEGRTSVIAYYPTAISSFVVPQVTMDNVTWVSVYGYPVVTGEVTSLLSSATAYVIPAAGWLKVRLIASFWSAGTTSVTLTATSAPNRNTGTGLVRLTQPTAFGATTQAVPGVSKYGLSQTIDSTKVFTEWGRVFRVTTDYISTGVAAQRPLMLIRNPAGSGTIIKILGITFQVPVTGSVEYRVYNAPTITAVGTALTPVGNRQTGQAAAIGLMYSLPTAAAFGNITTAVHLQNTTTPTRDLSEITRWLDAGNDMLITVEKSGAGVLACVTVDYVEQA